MKVSLTGLVLLISFNIYGQKIVDVKDIDDQQRFFLNKNMQVFKTANTLTLCDILSDSVQNQFIDMQDKTVDFIGYTDDIYWFRFQVSNTTDTLVNINLLLGQLGILDGQLFQSQNNNWVSLGKIGYQYPFESRPYHYAHFVYPIKIKAKTIDTFYLMTDERHAFRVTAAALLTPKAMQKATSNFYLFFGFIIGVLFLFFLFNIYLFFTNQDRIHAWYSLYIFLEIVFLTKHDSLEAQFLSMDSFFGYRFVGMLGVSALMVTCLIHVVQIYTKSQNAFTFLYKLTSWIKFFLLIMGTLHLLIFYIISETWIESLIVRITTNTISAALFLILLNSLYCIYKGNRGAWFVSIGLFIFIIGAVERVLFVETSTYLFPPNLFQIGMIIETTIISFGLMYRYRLYKEEKERISKELQVAKETKTREIIGAQEMERKRIAEDLHDDLGSNLAVIQLNLQTLKSEDHRKIEIIKLLEDTSARVRQISHNLMPPQFNKVPFEDVLISYFDQLNYDSNVDFTFNQVGKSEGLDKSQELMIYRMIMELTINVLKHSLATECIVQLFFKSKGYELVIEDNGVGFKVESGGIGLQNVRSRVEYLQGSLSIDTGNSGTTILIKIPIKANREY